MFFFCFKQKTAYEMRISDWSSDVCSSDLIFRPARPNGAAVILAPGGGYRYVVVDKEGYELARWLTARGVTVYVLFYRLPGHGWTNGAGVPLADAQRAVRLGARKRVV